MPIKVFVSYSWDSKEHQEWVIALTNTLRSTYKGFIFQKVKYCKDYKERVNYLAKNILNKIKGLYLKRKQDKLLAYRYNLIYCLFLFKRKAEKRQRQKHGVNPNKLKGAAHRSMRRFTIKACFFVGVMALSFRIHDKEQKPRI